METKGSKKLEVLQKSLQKKESELATRLENHFESVRSANGQPLNDKRNGQAIINMWNRQSDAIRNLNSSIEKTKQAIDRERAILAHVGHTTSRLPGCFIRMIESGEIEQWRKHPHTFFVPGVEKCRIIYDIKKGKISYKRPVDFSDADQWKKFAQTTNKLIAHFSAEKY